MAHSAIDTAYRLLQIAKEQGKELTSIQLQKLVYIAHGYHLGLYGLPLIRDDVQAWEYGAVILAIYRQFKGEHGAVSMQGIENIKLIGSFSEREEECLRGVVKLYGDDSGAELTNLTSQRNTPWFYVWSTREDKSNVFPILPNELIKNHFRKVVADPSSVSGL